MRQKAEKNREREKKMSVYVIVCILLCVSMFACVCVSVYMCVCICGYLSVCLCLCVCVRVCLYCMCSYLKVCMYVWERKSVCVCVWIVSDSFATNQKKFRKNLLQRNTSLVSTRTKKMPSNYFFVGICLSDGLDIKEPLKMIYDANKCNFFPPTFNASKPKKTKTKTLKHSFGTQI